MKIDIGGMDSRDAWLCLLGGANQRLSEAVKALKLSADGLIVAASPADAIAHCRRCFGAADKAFSEVAFCANAYNATMQDRSQAR